MNVSWVAFEVFEELEGFGSVVPKALENVVD